jgi:hypothetical protein
MKPLPWETAMLDEIRNHDAKPTPEERAWIDSNPFVAAVRVAVFLVFATAIGGYVSLYLEPPLSGSSVAKAGK